MVFDDLKFGGKKYRAKWTRAEFAKWAQKNACKPQAPQSAIDEYRSLDYFEYWNCPGFLYGDVYQVPLPDGWCEDCMGPLPKYWKWKLKVWQPKQ